MFPPTIIEFEISDKLQTYGVTRFEREGTTLLLMYKDKSIIFSIQKAGFFQTIREFERVSKDKIDQVQQGIIFQLSSDKYYQKVLGSDTVNQKEVVEEQNNQDNNNNSTTVETDNAEATEDKASERICSVILVAKEVVI